MKEIIKDFKDLAKTKDLWQVYRDFLETTAIAISNVVDLKQAKEREERYMQIITPYNTKEVLKFAEIMSLLAIELEKEPQDVLGKVFMELELGNKWKGQCFTPQPLADTLARLTFKEEEIKEKGFITALDPAVGGGVTMIALVKEMLRRGYNPQKQLLVVCGDVDSKAVHMTYIQLSLLGIPAVVKNQDTLTGDLMSTWYTPMYILDLWKFRRRDSERSYDFK